MKKKLYLLVSLIILASMVLAACSPAAEAPVVEEPVVEDPAVVEEPVVEEPTAEVEEPEAVMPAGPEALDTVFSAMLDTMAAYNTIKADALLAEMIEDEPPFLVDVRTTSELEENGHIEGAVHIPLNELAQHIDLLPDFDTPIVVYCGTGWRATIGMTALHGMGWTDVRVLKAVFADWKEAGNPVAESVPEAIALNAAQPDPALVLAADVYLVGIKEHGVKFGITTADDLNLALGENADLVVIDVRRQEEVDEKGHIDAPNYLHIPLESFVASRAEWPAADAPVVIYCGSGHRSTMAMTMMFDYGYADVLSLKGGYGGWKAAGYAVVGGAPTLADSYTAMLSNMVGYNTIKADALLLEMAEDTPPFILDVRSAAELEESGHIEGAAHIPLNELAQHTDLLPSFDTSIVVYCGTGWRATIGMTALHAMGWTDVRTLKYTFVDWKTDGNPVVEGLPEAVVLNAAQPAPSLVAQVDSALIGVKNMGTHWGVNPAENVNLALSENSDLILIDVRRAEELAENGVIAVVDQELIPIPLEQFIANMDMWPADIDAEIVIYCGSGHRSTMAMTILLSHGYSNVTSLKGGFSGWVTTGFPIAEFVAP